MEKPTILYVDDQPSHRALFSKAFASSYRILTVATPQEGLEVIKKESIFLVLADHNMPGMTGVEFLKEAKDLSPQAQRVLLSAHLEGETVREANKRAKVIGCLSKPWKLDPMKDFLEDAYRQYEKSITTIPTPSSYAEVPEICLTNAMSFCQLTEKMDQPLNNRAVQQIFLNFVEPRLRRFASVIRRPVPSVVMEAQHHALRGNFDGLQDALVRFFNGDIHSVMERIEDDPQGKFN